MRITGRIARRTGAAAAALLAATLVAASTATSTAATAQPVAAQSAAKGGPTVAAPATVTTDTGALHGAPERFLGVPYAAPPVGGLRWKSSQPAASWRGIREATQPAAVCAQNASPEGGDVFNEDCLTLDVYRPARLPKHGKLPVMVFVHGGGFTTGRTANYDGARMAEAGNMIVVMPQYRLGAFSALTLKDGPQGNFGLADQQAALRWVQRNIASFGGDRGNVTLSGESAGGMSVCAQLVSPAAKGLFHKAVIQSGGCTDGVRTEAEKTGAAVAKSLNCTDEACLRGKSAQEILTAWGPRGAGFHTGGADLPLDPAQAVAEGRHHRVPVVIGNTRDEMRGFMFGAYPLNQQKYEAAVADLGKAAPRALAAYPLKNYEYPEYALGALQTDRLVACPSRTLAASLAATTPTYFFEFADRTAPAFTSLGAPVPLPPGRSGGAYHTAELQYLVGYKLTAGPLDAEQRQLSDRMIAHWASFARTGTPSTYGTANWPRYTAGSKQVLEFRTGARGIRTVGDTDRRHQCWLWDSATSLNSFGG
ncbi:carboxylic ester hydrolase [Streptomyces spiroverticillatus]|uniref:Carboxylic ester hydrolase n=1 Tax=Streptomyces finlayi TaxID=67296 RepID=A0A918WYP0_9ACTN|nr:carboxylesterase family protein [Streptomyces finlayi]GHA15463.1 carboxylic ester hydrolase [Streptomyces spiroverticillatus]GHC96725.1 carboxylic ester hydrolase [Streptomyces finlayi]